jgi:hypothetical protein
LNLNKLATLSLDSNKLSLELPIFAKMNSLTELSLTKMPVTEKKEKGWLTLSFLGRCILFVIGILLLITSLLLNKNEKGEFEIRLNNFWAFLSNRDVNQKGFYRWVSNFLGHCRIIFDKIFPLKFKSPHAWAILIALNAAFLSFYDLTSFATISIVKNDFTQSRYLFVLGFYVLGLSPLYFRKINGWILLTVTFSLLFWYLLSAHATTTFIRQNIFNISFLLISSLLVYFYLKGMKTLLFPQKQTGFNVLLTATIMSLVIWFFVFGLRELPGIAFWLKSSLLWWLLYFVLTLNVPFIISAFLIVLYLILVLQLLVERLTFFLIENRIITNKSVAIPIAVILLSATSFLNTPLMNLLAKIFEILK